MADLPAEAGSHACSSCGFRLQAEDQGFAVGVATDASNSLTRASAPYTFRSGLDHPANVDRDGAIVGRVVDEIGRQRLDVAVEDQADQLAFRIDHRRAAIAADDVVGADEVVRDGEVQLPAGLGPAFRILVWWFDAVLVGTHVEPAEVGEWCDRLAILWIALDAPVR